MQKPCSVIQKRGSKDTILRRRKRICRPSLQGGRDAVKDCPWPPTDTLPKLLHVGNEKERAMCIILFHRRGPVNAGGLKLVKTHT